MGIARTATRATPSSANRQVRAARQFQGGRRDSASGRLRSLDRIVTALVIILVVFTPFALGAVYPWPAALIQIGVAVLVIIWAVKIASAARTSDAVSFPKSLPFVPPILLLAGFLLFQLIPLPPRVMRVLSPTTYQCYVKVLPGWPRKAPYSDKVFFAPSAQPVSRFPRTILPTIQEVQQGIPVPFSKKKPLPLGETGSGLRRIGANRGATSWKWRAVFPATWYPLAISPALTRTASLRFCAYAGLFLVLVGYPFADGGEGERRFYRSVLAAVLVTGVLVAAVGLVERVYWNGKVLWLFVPMDWGAPFPGTFPRATGPFVDPDHFANYLNMVFPLALAGALYELYSKSRRSAGAIRLLCASGAFIILSAIILSLSRAAWTGVAASTLVLSLLWANAEWTKAKDKYEREMAWRQRLARIGGERSEAPRLAPKWSTAAISGICLATLALIMLAALLIVGPQGRLQSDARVGQTIAEGGGLGLRPIVWGDSLKMVRDFPLFGVGLGGWPEIFPRYQTGPWSEYYFREAHNDYLQYITETGLIGLLAAIWFIGLAAKSLSASRHYLSLTDRPLMAALVLALATMAFHELVDFCLHVPANALLFTLLFAIAVRIALAQKSGGVITTAAHRSLLRVAAGMAVASSALLIVLALTQPGLAYPYDIERASFPARARAVVIEHPASAQAHLSLVKLAGTNLTPGMRLDELATATWLDPTDPFIRDWYAEMLSQAGREKESLDEVAESVFNSPASGTHAYLDKRLIPWLLAVERNAVRRGFMRAVAAGYPGAVSGLGAFDDTLGDFSDEVRLYVQAASRIQTASKRATYFIAAAEAAVRAGNARSAQALFRRAIEAAPSLSEPYVNLVEQVYGPAKDMRAAQSATHEGVRNGADPPRLYMALATAAQMSENQAVAESAMLKALRYDPSFSMIMRVAQFYLQSDKAERAASMLQNATEINPVSADAFYLLGVAEERDYQYSAADKAYARAAILAPQQFRPVYSAFRQRMENSKSAG
jgi:O-antigen ligase/tetratricopeptide (TPR) repeat protein